MVEETFVNALNSHLHVGDLGSYQEVVEFHISAFHQRTAGRFLINRGHLVLVHDNKLLGLEDSQEVVHGQGRELLSSVKFLAFLFALGKGFDGLIKVLLELGRHFNIFKQGLHVRFV